MRVIFMGTPEFSVASLAEILAAGHEVVAVYTQAPKPAGRGHKLRPSPVQDFAVEHGLEVRTHANFKAPQDREDFANLDADVAVVVAYGLILPQAVLEAPRYGCLNLHGSMLPRWRGAAPMQRAIMAGDEMTAAQIMQMETGLDTGPILLSETVAIGPQETAGTLHDKLAVVGANLWPRVMAALERGGLDPVMQAQEGIAYAAKLTNDETRIDWSRSAAAVDCQIRGLSPFPGAWFELPDKANPGQRVRVKALFSQSTEGSGAPGTILTAQDVITVACGSGAVTLHRLQRAGKKVQDTGEFLRGFSVVTGTKLT